MKHSYIIKRIVLTWARKRSTPPEAMLANSAVFKQLLITVHPCRINLLKKKAFIVESKWGSVALSPPDNWKDDRRRRLNDGPTSGDVGPSLSRRLLLIDSERSQEGVDKEEHTLVTRAVYALCVHRWHQVISVNQGRFLCCAALIRACWCALIHGQSAPLIVHVITACSMLSAKHEFPSTLKRWNIFV